MDLPVLGLSHKWDHTIRGLLQLITLTERLIERANHPFIRAVAQISPSVLFMSEYDSAIWVDQDLCICCPACGHWSRTQESTVSLGLL